jgi:CHASE3 domain sensor protein
MFENLTVNKRLLAGFGLAAFTLILVAGFSYHNANLLIDTERWVTHTHQVRTELADLLSELKDAETGQRGYLLTGEESYLEPYKGALTTIKTTFDDVKKLTLDNPDQQRRLAAIGALIESKLAELKQTIDLRRTQGFDAALKVVLTNEGKTYMDQMRNFVAEADHEEQTLLERRS